MMVGHRARDCWYSRRQPMRNGSTRRADEPWRKGPGSGTCSGQKTGVAEQGKAQIWMKKTEQLHMGEIDQSRDDGYHVDNQP